MILCYCFKPAWFSACEDWTSLNVKHSQRSVVSRNILLKNFLRGSMEFMIGNGAIRLFKIVFKECLCVVYFGQTFKEMWVLAFLVRSDYEGDVL